MQEKSLIECALEIVSKSKKPVAFKDLFEKVLKLRGEQLSDAQIKEKIGKFYTQLSIDGRFIQLENNTWDIRSRYAYNRDKEFEYDEDEDEDVLDAEEEELLRKERGEEEEEEIDSDSDDLDFDKPQVSDEDEGDF